MTDPAYARFSHVGPRGVVLGRGDQRPASVRRPATSPTPRSVFAPIALFRTTFSLHLATFSLLVVGQVTLGGDYFTISPGWDGIRKWTRPRGSGMIDARWTGECVICVTHPVVRITLHCLASSCTRYTGTFRVTIRARPVPRCVIEPGNLCHRRRPNGASTGEPG